MQGGSPVRKWFLRNFLSYWPPFLGAGVRVVEMGSDFRRIVVELKLNFLNRNYVGTQFGGSLYSMVDPFYMLMVMENLGPDYIVWDKAATIRFLKPGKSAVRATFVLTDAKLAEIRAALDQSPKCEPEFLVEVVDREGVVVASINKTLYVRRKPKRS